MSGLVLILRPQPGADESAARARALGLSPVIAPLFRIEPLDWQPPNPAGFDAVVLTSANALRHAGPKLAPFRHLPAFAVGEATAAAAGDAGFGDIRTGPADVGALTDMMAEQGVRRAFHPCGADHVAPTSEGLSVMSIPVYWSAAAANLDSRAIAAIERGALALLHSPRAGQLFGALVGARRDGIRIAAISASAAEAAGAGWRSVAIADRPRDQALLELAAKPCQNEGE
jgi:uroporphyrinogen-III synthase